MASSSMPVTVLIMCENEEQNIGYALDSVVGYASQVVVADSFSTDRTAQIIREKYPMVDFYQSRFIHWAQQRNWMLEHCNIKNEIVLFLDADEQAPSGLIDEILEIERSGKPWRAADVKIEYYFLGSRLRHAYGHPRIKRIFKKTGLRFAGDGAREYALVSSDCVSLRTPLIHSDHKPLETWLMRHIHNAEMEGIAFIGPQTMLRGDERRALTTILRLKLLVRSHIWNRLPLLMRPFLYFFYRYIVKGGFLDGAPGLVYCYLHAVWYMSLVDIKIYEWKRRLHEGHNTC